MSNAIVLVGFRTEVMALKMVETIRFKRHYAEL